MLYLEVSLSEGAELVQIQEQLFTSLKYNSAIKSGQIVLSTRLMAETGPLIKQVCLSLTS